MVTDESMKTSPYPQYRMKLESDELFIVYSKIINPNDPNDKYETVAAIFTDERQCLDLEKSTPENSRSLEISWSTITILPRTLPPVGAGDTIFLMHPTEYEEENSEGEWEHRIMADIDYGFRTLEDGISAVESKTVRADGPVFQEVVVGEVHLNGSQNYHEVDVWN